MFTHQGGRGGGGGGGGWGEDSKSTNRKLPGQDLKWDIGGYDLGQDLEWEGYNFDPDRQTDKQTDIGHQFFFLSSVFQ